VSAFFFFIFLVRNLNVQIFTIELDGFFGIIKIDIFSAISLLDVQKKSPLQKTFWDGVFYLLKK